jgi:hypothetical protein
MQGGFTSLSWDGQDPSTAILTRGGKPVSAVHEKLNSDLLCQ